MSEPLRVDAETLHQAGGDVFAAVRTAGDQFTVHEAGLAEAAGGWIGQSRVALGELMVRWETQHGKDVLAVNNTAGKMIDAATAYAAGDEDGQRRIDSAGSAIATGDSE